MFKMKNNKILLPILLIVFTLTACGNMQTANPEAPSDTSTEAPVTSDGSGMSTDSAGEMPGTSTFEATVIEAAGHTILVEPVSGSTELNSAGRIVVPLSDDMAFQPGDLVEITYNGEIMESDPAQLGKVHEITLIESASEAAPPEADAKTGTETDTEAAQIESDHKWDRIPMVMVNDKLYRDTGRESTAELRCGNMDGEITSTVDGSQIPAKNNESNFGSGFGYQYGADDTIEVYMNEKWFVFECISSPSEPSVK